MPELPEIKSRAQEMNASLVGKVISGIEVIQPKSLNIPVDEYTGALTGAAIQDITSQGKWLFVKTNQGWLLLNMGMGGEILLTNRGILPEKYRLVFDFEDNSCLAINFWWFGYAHYARLDELESHKMTARLGPDALAVDSEEFQQLLAGRRGRVKSFLLDQSKIAGIGNAYIHDILFLARLHPLRQINDLDDNQVEALWHAIQDGLQPSVDKGGAFYELNLYGEHGGFTKEDILIGYREDEPCPECSTPIEKIKTGSTSSFICPSCQK